jgi:hypothetical protein
MGKKKRRRKKEEAQLRKKINATEPSILQPPPSPPRRAFQLFRQTVSWTKVGLGVLGAVLTALTYYGTFHPHVSVEPFLTLDPVNPYKTQFSVKNENSIFDVRDVECVCWPRRMESGNGFSIVSPGLLPNVGHTIPTLVPGGSSVVDCPPVIGGLGTYSGNVDFAELEIVVSYKQSWWPITTTRYPFKAMQDANKAVHWVHTTPAEEKPILP